MSSSSGSGADQHLLALLRAIRLRQTAPDAAAAGAADAAAALTERLGGDGPDTLQQTRDIAAAPGVIAPTETGSGATAPGPPGPGEGRAGRPGWAWGAPDDSADDGEAAGEPSVAADPASVAPSRDSEPPPTPKPPARPNAARSSSAPDRAVETDPPPGGYFDHGPQLRPAGLPPAAPTGGVAVPSPPKQPQPPQRSQPQQTPTSAPPAPTSATGGPTADNWGGSSGPSADVGADHAEQVWRDRTAPARSSGAIGAISAVPSTLSGIPEVVPLVDAHAPRAASLAAALDQPVLGTAGGVETVAASGELIDGMDPADDALLRQTRRFLSTSLTFAGGPDEVGERLRTALERAHPALLAALPGNEHSQIEQLAEALTWLVHTLDDPPTLVSGCGRLGAALAECGVEVEQLRLVGAALAEAMRAGIPAGGWRQDFDLAWRSTWQHAYEWLRHGGSEILYRRTVWSAVVVGHELRRRDLAVLRLRPYLPMPFRPGQFARIQVPALPGVWRPYSLTGKPRTDTVVELHVRAKTELGVSGVLVNRTKVGDHVEISRAEGEMGLPKHSQRDLLLIAGDTGVVPLKALLTELAATDDPRSAVLFWGVRNLAELYDIADVAEIARSAKRATVIPVIAEGNPGPYASGLVTDAVAAYGNWADHEAYLAGPPLMLAETTAALQRLGVPPEQIHHDLPE